MFVFGLYVHVESIVAFKWHAENSGLYQHPGFAEFLLV
jgi:hypothetical protein